MLTSIRTRLIIALVTLGIIPLVLVGVVLTNRTYRVQREQVIISQQETAERISGQVETFVRERETDLRISSQIAGVQSQTAEEQHRFLLEMLSYQPAFDELAILNRTGQEVSRASRTAVVTDDDLIDRSQSLEFGQALAGETYFSPVTVDEATGQLVISLALPLTDVRTAEITHVMVADVRLRFLAPLLQNVTTSDNVYVLNEAGRVVAHPASSLVLRDTRFDLPGASGIFTGLTGEEVVLATSTFQLGDQTLTVVAEKPTDEALSLVQNTRNTLAGTILVTGLIALVLGLVASRIIVRPLQNLAATAQKIQAGDLSLQAEIRSQDEIGVLAQAFNSMTNQLRMMVENLEERVADRTRDLEVAADVSRQITTILDQDSLLSAIVERTKAGFDLYHVSIFLYDETTQMVTLAAGAGDAGQKLKQEGRQFSVPHDQGLVPTALRTRQPVVINDVTQEARYTPNPHLPLTRAETALPMIIGETIIGVLDFQSEQVNRFSPDDVRVMTTLAEQIAIAVNNVRLYEDSLKTAEQLREVDAIKSRFLASMSHELRTPLNAILNFTKFVSSGMLGTVNEKQLEALNKVSGSGKHLLSLINDVLDITKIESGMLSLFIEPEVSVQTELDTVLATAETLLADKPAVKLVRDIDPQLPDIVADKRRIRQILLNLVSNACKFTEEGHITVTAHVQGSRLRMSVQDTGPGIAPEDQETIFEAFRQTSVGLSQGGGTGLGLAIAKRLATAHEGHLWLESQVGTGTTFYVDIPIASESLKAQIILEGAAV